MTLKDRLAQQGNFLFRWRSYLPLVLLFPAGIAIHDGLVLETTYSASVEHYWMGFCLLVSFMGLAIRWFTVGFVPGGTSGRNTKDQRAHALNTTGMYSIVRNPLYLGNFIAIFGVVLACQEIWFAVITALAYTVYIERIVAAEEKFLTEKYGANYVQWANKTPPFFPAFSQWEKPALPFSIRTVMKREYNGVLAVCIMFFVIEFLSDVVVEKEPLQHWMRDDWMWIATLGFGFSTFLILRSLKKYTGVLKVKGR